MGSTSEWGKTVLAARDRPTPPVHIDGVPYEDYMQRLRTSRGGGSPSKGGGSMELTPMQILLEGKKGDQYTQSLSQGLRDRKDMGEMLSLVGNKNQQQFGGSYGGPIAQDKAHFFFAVD